MLAPDSAAQSGCSPQRFPQPAHFALLLGLFLIAAFPEVIFGARTFFYRDFAIFGYPLAFHHRESFWAGEIPLWNPFNHSGLPFLAQWNTMVLYPPALIYLLLPLSWSLAVFCLVHLFFGGLGMFRLAERWTGHRLASAAAGVVFAFNGFTLSCLKWPNNIAAVGWMPWVILLAERAWNQGGRWIPLAALAGAMQMLSGGPEIILFTWCIVGLLWIGTVFSRIRRPRTNETAQREDAAPARTGLRLAGVIALVIALAAAQLLPFLQLLAHSQRSAAFRDVDWAMPLWGPIHFLLPLFGTFPSYHGVRVQPGQFWIASYYAGAATVAIAGVALFAGTPRWRTWLLAGIGALSIWMALGDTGLLYASIVRLFPMLEVVRFPIKFVVPALFVLPVLLALGLAKLISENEPDRESQRLSSVFVISCAIVLLTMAIVLALPWQPAPAGDPAVPRLNGYVRMLFLALIAAVVWMLRRSTVVHAGSSRSDDRADARRTQLLGAGLLVLIWFDLLTHSPELNPTVERWAYEPGLVPAQLQWESVPKPGESRAMIGPWADQRLNHLALTNAIDDVLYSRFAQFANMNLLDRIPKVDGFFSLAINDETRVRHLLYSSTNASFPQLERFLGVSRKTAPGKLIEWQSTAAHLPFATAGQAPVFLDGPSALRAMADPDFDPARTVFLDPAIESTVPAVRPSNASVQVIDFAAHRIELSVTAPEPAWVVVAQAAYAPWTALRNDEPIPIHKANHAFQAFSVPSGTSTIVLEYRDQLFHWGAAISLVALLLSAALLLRSCQWFRQSRNG